MLSQVDFRIKPKTYRKGKAICKVDNCNNTVVGFGYCYKHYREYKRYKTIRKRHIKTPNEIVILEHYAKMFLYNYKCEVVNETIIDLDDVEKVSKYKWYYDPTVGYVRRNTINKKIYLHRFIMNFHNYFTSDNYVDHINMNKLDNRKSNLRLCTNKENMENTIAHKKKYPIEFTYNL